MTEIIIGLGEVMHVAHASRPFCQYLRKKNQTIKTKHEDFNYLEHVLSKEDSTSTKKTLQKTNIDKNLARATYKTPILSKNLGAKINNEQQ